MVLIEAYTVVQVAQKLPLQIESICGDENTVLAGTKSGFLLIYTIQSEKSDHGSRDYNMQICKNFSKKPVTQLQLIKELDLLICLSDGTVTVHDCLQINYPQISVLQKAKGASMFATELTEEKLPSSDLCVHSLRLCVVMRRKVLLFHWNNREFLELPPTDLNCPDVAKVVCWCGTSIALGFRDEYFIVSVDGRDIQSGTTPRPLFTTGSRGVEPLIFKIPLFNVIGFLRDEATVFRTYDGGDPVESLPDVRWSDVPLAIEADAPFLVALLPRGKIEVRTIRPSVLLQEIELTRARLLCYASSQLLFVAALGTNSDLWYLNARTRLKDNISKLLSNKQYEVAEQLAELCDDEQPTEEEKQRFIVSIKNSRAFHLFCLRKFNEAFEIFREIKIEPLYVIGLFPDLLPDEFQKNIASKYPDKLPKEFPKTDLQNGLVSLQGYLSEIRTDTARALERQRRMRQGEIPALSEDEMVELRNLLQIVDTTLLKCYLQTNDMFVASLLRLPDNSCNVVESEKILKQHQKFNELLLLYEKREMHVAALELLRTQSKDRDSSLDCMNKTVTYLQNLGAEHFELICKYASWVLRESPENGLKIFTENTPSVELLPRQRVLEFLRTEAYTTVIPYLEHCITLWNDESAKFHNCLAEQYVIRVKALMTDYLHGLPEGHSISPAGKEPGELGDLRGKLLSFLETSLNYNPDIILAQIPHDAMYEERALLFGRLGMHESAIAIYTNILHDSQQAERYCRQHYSRSKKEDAEVFLILFRQYACPSENSVIGLMQSNIPKPPPNLPSALRVLKNYAAYIDTVKAIEMLPTSMRLEELWLSLEALLQEKAVRRRDVEINRALFYSQHLRTQCEKAKTQSVKVLIDTDLACVKCRKKIGNSAFARHRDGTIVHYYCFKQSAERPRVS